MPPPPMSHSPPLSYPSPSSSIAETTIPTPDQPYSSRRTSLASPIIVEVDEMPPFGDEHDTPRKLDEPIGDLFSVPAPAARASEHNHAANTHGSPRRLPRRAATGPGSTRAPPPPPILLRRPTDVNGHGALEDIPLATGSSASSGHSPSRSQFQKGGLNISGLEHASGRMSGPEENGSLANLLASPRPSSFFAAADPAGAPVSPMWQSFERQSPKPGAGFNGSPVGRRRSRASLDVPFSPLGAVNEKRVLDPTPQHGIHARNLSLYFPQPGQVPPATASGSSLNTSPDSIPAPVMPAGDDERGVFGGSGNWSFGRAAGNTLSPHASGDTPAKGKRRGHHHKHSLSHNFFSFLDPTQTNPALSGSPIPKTADKPQSVPMPMLSATSDMASANSLSPLPPSKDASHRQMLGSFAIFESLIGAGLWVEGQMSGWRCLAGIGYLVVFDAMGVGVSMVSQNEGAWSSIRRPYGSTRFVSLLYFAQSLFLVFAAVYIAKETLEQVVLGAGAHEHGGGGGAHSHGEPIMEGDERPFPMFLLISATLASAFSGFSLANHTKLVEAVGPLFLPSRLTTSRLVKAYPDFLNNPFSLTIAGSSLAILAGSIIVPSESHHSLDSILSLLQTVLVTALAYPPTLAFGHVLLQTAPPSSASQMKLLKRALREITDDSRVLGTGAVKCWSIGATAPPLQSPVRQSFSASSAPNSMPGSPVTGFGFSSAAPMSPASSEFAKLGEGPISSLVLSMTVHVHPQVSDNDVLDVTRMAWSKVNNAVTGHGPGRQKAGGEISVGVKRGWEGVEEAES